MASYNSGPELVTGTITLGNRVHNYPFGLAGVLLLYASLVYMAWRGRENQRAGDSDFHDIAIQLAEDSQPFTWEEEMHDRVEEEMEIYDVD